GPATAFEPAASCIEARLRFAASECGKFAFARRVPATPRVVDPVAGCRLGIEVGETVQCEFIASSKPRFDPALEGRRRCLMVIARNDQKRHWDRAGALHPCDQLLASRLRRGSDVMDRHAHRRAAAESRNTVRSAAIHSSPKEHKDAK